jgi:hypothetical protein
VTLEQVVLLDESNNAVLSPLPAVPQRSFPLEIAPGEGTIVDFTIETADVLNSEEAASVCAGSVRVRVVLTDSLVDTTLTLTSPPATPQCN